MKASSAWVYGGLAALGLAAVYVSSKSEPAPAEDGAVVLDLSRRDLRSISFEDGRGKVELTSKDSEVWLRTEAHAAPDAGTLTTAVGGRLLRGNAEAERVLQRFAPLRAVRMLGSAGPEKLKEWGLESPSRQLEVLFSNGSARYQVGSSALGLSAPYLQGADGQVYLLGNGIFSELEAASSRLVDRTLHAFPLADVDQVSVRAGEVTRRFSATTSSSGTALVGEGQQVPDALAQNWHRRVWSAVPIELLGIGEVPSAGEPSLKTRVDYARGGKPLGFVELAAAGEDVFLRTEHTAGWVRAPKGTETLLSESDRVARGER